MTQAQQWKRAAIYVSVMAIMTGGLGILGDYLLHAAFN
jgi:hypothetical protein